MSGAANDNDQPAFTLTRAQLEALVSHSVSAALALRNSLPVLVDKQELASQLGCSASHVDHLRKDGLPTLRVGQLMRFEPAKVMEWLRERSLAG